MLGLQTKLIAGTVVLLVVVLTYHYISHLRGKVAEGERQLAVMRFEVQALTVGKEQLEDAAKAASKKAEKVRTITVTKIKEIKVPSSCPEQLDYLYEVAK